MFIIAHLRTELELTIAHCLSQMYSQVAQPEASNAASQWTASWSLPCADNQGWGGCRDEVLSRDGHERLFIL